MNKYQLAANKVPPVAEEFVHALRAAFTPRRIKKGMTHEEIMWEAAQAEVVEWVQQYARGNRVSGDPKDLNKPEPKQPWWRRLVNWWR